MDCRGHWKRVDIVKNYTVTPMAHLPVLSGTTVESDAGGDITDSYFLFLCVHKITKKEEMICCGLPTAKDFSSLLHVDLPRIYNPLLDAVSVSSSGINTGTGSVGNSAPLRWDPTREQLYNAALLFQIWLNTQNKRNIVVLKIIRELQQDTQTKPSARQIKSVNTLYKKYGTRARNVVNELSRKNPMRAFGFDLLVAELEKNHIEQFFENQ